MSTTIVQYSPTEAVLSELTRHYKDTIYDVATASGLADAKAARKEIRTWRVGLEKERVKAKAEALEHCRNVDSEAKRITAILESLETPIDDQIKARERAEAAAKAAEAERTAALHARVEKLRGLPLAWLGRSSSEIAGMIEKIEALPIGPEFAELTAAATEVRAETLAKLRQMRDSAHEAEAGRAELERRRAEQAERDRVEQARIAEESRQRFEAERQSRLAIEAQERASRERIEAEERRARVEREKADEAARQARLAEQARLDVERQRVEAERRRVAEADRQVREAAEEKAREERRREADRSDALEMLATFRERFGALQEFAEVTKAIDAYLSTVAKARAAYSAKLSQLRESAAQEGE